MTEEEAKTVKSQWEECALLNKQHPAGKNGRNQFVVISGDIKRRTVTAKCSYTSLYLIAVSPSHNSLIRLFANGAQIIENKKRAGRESCGSTAVNNNQRQLDAGLLASRQVTEEVFSRHQALLQYLTNRNVIGDGNCFYRAACYSLHGSDACHTELRQELADYVLKQGSVLGGLVSATDNSVMFSKYVQALLTDGECVGEEAVVALANMCVREVHIYSAHVDTLVYLPASGSVTGPPVSLAFFEPGHYHAVVPVPPSSPDSQPSVN
jgi:hypothetical protein